mgnify:FL=1
MDDKKLLILNKAEEIIECCNKNGVNARLMGGTAIYIKCPSAEKDPFKREINDIDIVIYHNEGRKLKNAISESGFMPDKQFNSIHGETRMLFKNGDIDLDVFVGKFIQCHELNLEENMKSETDTIPLSDLLLTKLQVVQINLKDIKDILLMLTDHEFSEKQESGFIDINRILKVVGRDWGWYTTISDNLQKIKSMLPDIFKDDEKGKDDVSIKIDELKKRMAEEKKTLQWKLRSKIGRKVKWYELPEEK